MSIGFRRRRSADTGQLPEQKVDIAIFEAAWANPQGVERSTVINHFTGDPDNAIEYHFTDFDVRPEKPVSLAGDICYLTSLVVRDAEVQFSCDLQVGDPIVKFRSALGEPLLMSTDELVVYEWRKLELLGSGDYSAGRALVGLRVAEDGAVTQISWGWYSD